MNLYKFLENPFCYRMLMKIFSIGGGSRKMTVFLDHLMARDCHGLLLEVGSGPSYRNIFSRYGENYVVTDINFQYMQYSKSKYRSPLHVLCDAMRLPFFPSTFDCIFSLALFHHLSDQQTLDALQEMQNCLKPGGKIIIVDAFQTERRWDLVSRALSRLDRGQNVRTRASMLALIKKSGNLQVEEHHVVPGQWPYSFSAYLLTPLSMGKTVLEDTVQRIVGG